MILSKFHRKRQKERKSLTFKESPAVKERKILRRLKIKSTPGIKPRISASAGKC